MVTDAGYNLVIRPIFRHRVFRLGRDFLAFSFNVDRHLWRKARHHELRFSLHGARYRFHLRRSSCSPSARGIGQLDPSLCRRDFSRYIDGAACDCRAQADAPQISSHQCVNSPPEILLIQTIRSTQGMAVAPHALASQSALDDLLDIGNYNSYSFAVASPLSIATPLTPHFCYDTH